MQKYSFVWYDQGRNLWSTRLRENVLTITPLRQRALGLLERWFMFLRLVQMLTFLDTVQLFIWIVCMLWWKVSISITTVPIIPDHLVYKKQQSVLGSILIGYIAFLRQTNFVFSMNKLDFYYIKLKNNIIQKVYHECFVGMNITHFNSIAIYIWHNLLWLQDEVQQYWYKDMLLKHHDGRFPPYIIHR